MCKNSIEKTGLKKSLQVNKKVRIYDTGGRRLVILQRRFIRKLETYFKLEKTYRENYIDGIAELNVNIKKIQGGTIAIKKVLTDNQQKEFNDLASKYIFDSMLEGEKQFKADMPTSQKYNIAFGIKSKDAVDYARTRAGELIKGIDETTKKRVQYLITEAIDNGDTVADLKKSLIKHFAFSKYRAGLIASTELGGAYLAGKKESYIRTAEYYGINPNNGRKQVIVHDDDRICPICAPCIEDREKWIPFDDNFSNGLPFAIFHIGCRCNTTFSMFNPDAPEIPRVPKDRKDIRDVPVDEKPKEYKNVKELEVELDTYFIASPSLKWLPLPKAIPVAKTVKEMYDAMPFLDRIPEFKVSTGRTFKARVRRDRHYKTLKMDVSKNSIGNLEGTIQKSRNEADLKRLKGLLDTETNEGRITYIKGKIRDVENRSEAYSMSGIAGSEADSIRTTVIHEFGHVLDNFIRTKHLEYKTVGDMVNAEFMGDIARMVDLKLVRFAEDLRKKNILTEYAKTNREEIFAESWTAYRLGYYERISPDVKEMFDTILDRLISKYAIK